LRDAPSVTACRTCQATPEVIRSHAGHQGPSRLRHRTRIWPRSTR
jgi:hypothetical protein